MDARKRILQIAERLFAKQGVEATSVRMITEAAGANVAAVNYHFGDKKGLVGEIVRRSFMAMDEERCKRLDRLEALADGGAEPDMRDVIEAFLGPMLDAAASPRGRHLLRLTARLMWDPAFRLEELFDECPPPSLPRFDRLLCRAAPGLADDPAQRFWRTQFAVGATLHAMKMMSAERFWPPPPEGAGSPSVEQLRELLLEFVSAGFQASSRC